MSSPYEDGTKPFPPIDDWVPRIFHRIQNGEPMFYIITLPEDECVALHAELNPGTTKIEDAITGEVLWSLQ